MRCVQCLLLFCLVSAGLSSPRHEGDQTRRVKRSDDVSFGALQTLVQQQASTIDRLQADLTAYKNRVDSMDNQLQTMQHKTDAELQTMKQRVDAALKTVAFTAFISTSPVNLGDHQTLVFDKVVTNIGGAYNPHTGVFAAPVNGTYVFFVCQMSPNTHSDLYLNVVVDGATLAVVNSAGSGNVNRQGSNQVSTHLTAGDQVWVRQASGNAVWGYWWTTFTGFLLHAD